MHHLCVYKYNNNMYTYNYMTISSWKGKELNEQMNPKCIKKR